jgi:hypothetical protein
LTTRPLRLGRLFFRTVIGALFLAISIFTYGQDINAAANGFTLNFLNQSTSGSVNQVASNVVKAINKSGRTMVFNIELSGPAEWRSLNDPKKVYNLRSGDSLFIPTRIIPPKDALGNVNYFVNVSAYTVPGVFLASAPWSTELKKVSKWSANIIENQKYFPSDGDSTSFKLNLRNFGNSAEIVTVLLIPDNKVLLKDKFGNAFAENTFTLNLPVDIDTTLTIFATLNRTQEKKEFFNSGSLVDQQKAIENLYKVNVGVKGNDGERTWNGRVDIRKLNDSKVFESQNGSATIPVNVEFNAYNILSQFTNFTLDLNGDVDLGSNKNLRYYYQSIISTSAYTGTQFMGSYKFAQYSSSKMVVAAGDIGQNMEILVSGTGLKGSYQLGKVRVGAIFTNKQQNANLNNDLTSAGFQADYRSAKGIGIKTELVYRQDEFNQINGTVGVAKFDYKLFGNNYIKFSAGLSNEDHLTLNPFSTTGYGFSARYSGKVKGATISSQFRFNSPGFLSQYRGVTALNANFRYPLGTGKYAGIRIQSNTREAEIYSRGFLFPVNKYKRSTAEIRYAWSTEVGNFIVYPKVNDDEVLGLRTFTYGAGLTFSTNNTSDIRFFTRFFMGMTKAKDYELAPYLVTRWENSLRYKKLNVTARYYYGPYNVLDNLRVIEDGIIPQSVFLSAYSTFSFSNARVTLRPLINVGYESLLARTKINFSNVLTYYSVKGLQFNLTVELLNMNQGESQLSSGFGGDIFDTYSETNFLLKMGVKKQFNIKKPGNKNSDLEVVLFKDLNGNNIRDKGEEFVSNALITVNGEKLMTNTLGSVFFKNLPPELYEVKTEIVTELDGWFKTDEVSVVLDKDQTVFIPLKRGARIEGKIMLQRAQFSAFSENGVKLDRIRITVKDMEGNIYEGLSGSDGKFRMYVPFGQYTIRVNGAGIDKQFEFAQSSYAMEINNSEMDYSVTFYLIEKRRAVNINKGINKN